MQVYRSRIEHLYSALILPVWTWIIVGGFVVISVLTWVRDEFLSFEQREAWRIPEILPHWSLTTWLICLLIVTLIVLFEGSYRLAARLNKRITSIAAEVESLKEKQRPKIRALYDPTIPNCRAPTALYTTDLVGNTHGIRGMVFRLEVINIGGATIENCRGAMTEFRPCDQDQFYGPEYLTWASAPHPRTVTRLVERVRQHLDLVMVCENGRVLIFTENTSIYDCGVLNQPGEYILSIVLSGDNTPTTEPYTLKLTVTDNWETAHAVVLSAINPPTAAPLVQEQSGTRAKM